MRLERDPEADAVYVYLGRKKYAYGIDIDGQRRVDYSADGSPIGVELLNVSAGVDLTGLPRAGEIIGMLDAKGIGACMVEDRRGSADRPDTTELLVLCGGRYHATKRSAVRTRSIVTIALPGPNTGPAGTRVRVVEEALTR